MVILIILFIYGLIVGSFLNALIYRLEVKKSLKGRSFCPSCKEQIRWYDLVPVLSWFMLRGKCRNCKKPISVQYPLVELSTAFIFSLTGYFLLYLGSLSLINIVNTLFWLFFASCLIAIFVYDAKHQIIPDEIIYTALVVALVYMVLISFLLGDYQYAIRHLLAGLIAGGFFFTMAAVSKGKWMGGGDIKLVAFMGLALGVRGTVVALYVAFILGAISGVALIVSKKKKMASKIAFGPFLVVGTFIGLFYGGQIISFYVNMFM